MDGIFHRAILHVPEQEDSTAVQFLKHRGVTKDSVYAEHRYSDNATQILELAAARSSELSKSVVGTEDLLWGLFATEDHAHSRCVWVSSRISAFT